MSKLNAGLSGQALVGRSDISDSNELVTFLRAFEAGVAFSATPGDEAGIRILENHDYGVVAEDGWRTRPRTLDVSRQGLNQPADVRRSLRMLSSDIDLAALVD